MKSKKKKQLSEKKKKKKRKEKKKLGEKKPSRGRTLPSTKKMAFLALTIFGGNPGEQKKKELGKKNSKVFSSSSFKARCTSSLPFRYSKGKVCEEQSQEEGKKGFFTHPSLGFF